MKDPPSIVSARNFSRAERSSADEKSPWLLAASSKTICNSQSLICLTKYIRCMHTALRIDTYIVYIHIHICSKQLNNNMIQVSLFFVHTLQNDIWYQCNLGFCLRKLQSGVRLRWLTDKSCGQKLKINVQFPLSQLLRVLLKIHLFLVESCEPSTWTTFGKMSNLTCVRTLNVKNSNANAVRTHRFQVQLQQISVTSTTRRHNDVS